jgi:hypothetical protein
MSCKALLKKLDPLTHAARMKYMAEVGQKARRDPRLGDTVRILEKGGFYERLLALQSCFGSGDGSHAMRALNDPSRTIQGRALKLIALFANDKQVKEALLGARADLRLTLVAHLRKRRRFPPLDAFFEELARGNPGPMGKLLPYASAPAVARHFDRGRQAGGLAFWRRLARFHPDLAVKKLRALASRESPDAQVISEANAVVAALAGRRPDQALKLVNHLTSHVTLGQLSLDVLGLRRPAEVVDLLLASNDQVAVNLGQSAHRLDAPRLQSMLERRPGNLGPPEVWFRRLPPALRARVFPVAAQAWRDADGCIAPLLLRYLPRRLRDQEARRHITLPVLATRPAMRLGYAALSPWQEAMRLAEPFLNNPEAELRSAALQALTGAVRFERSQAAELVNLLQTRRHEQDPVRCAMLAGLAELPPGLWRTEHLDGLGQIIRDALGAADLSYASAAHAESLVLALLPFHPQWSAAWLVTLVRERGQINLGNLEQRVTDADVRRIAPALAPVLKAWQSREREYQLVNLAQSLGRRVQVFDRLVEILARLLQETRDQWLAASLLSVMERHQRPRLAALVPELIRQDPSWITQAGVLKFIHRHRQDLITPFLGQRPYRGRFSTGKTRHVLPLRSGFFRWTPAQQTVFAQTLEELTHARDKMRDLPAILHAIGQLAALPALGPKRLAELAQDKRPAVQEGALRALGRLDSGQGVLALLESLADDRARVAIYALRQPLLAMPAAHAIQLLQVVPLTKVTVAKEYVRLLGEMPAQEAFQELQKLHGQPLHRDVRVALLRALWGHLDRTEAWEILDRTAGSPDPALMTNVVRIPADCLSDAARQRLVTLLVRVLDHPDPSVRVAVLNRCQALPVADPKQLLLPRLLQSMGSSFPDERTAAAAAVFATCQRADAPQVEAAVKKITADRRALLAAVRALQAALPWHRGRLVPVARSVITAMEADPLTAGLRAELAGQSLPWDELADAVQRMAEAGQLHAEALEAAIQSIGSWPRRPDRSNLEQLETRWSTHPDERLRRLALAALVHQAQLPGGWDEARLRRLRAFRADRSPLVAGAAHFTLPAEELQPVLAGQTS